MRCTGSHMRRADHVRHPLRRAHAHATAQFCIEQKNAFGGCCVGRWLPPLTGFTLSHPQHCEFWGLLSTTNDVLRFGGCPAFEVFGCLAHCAQSLWRTTPKLYSSA